MFYIIFSQIINPNLLGDYYKHNLFIYYYNYIYFQAFYAHRNKIINCKNLYLINLFEVNNFHLQNDF